MSATATSEEFGWANAAAAAAEAGPGFNTVIVHVGDVLGITEYFVITSGANARSVRALAERVEQGVDAAGGPKPDRIEGLTEREWVLMDYGPFVVHIFSEQARQHYQLDRLWRDCPTQHVQLEEAVPKAR